MTRDRKGGAGVKASSTTKVVRIYREVNSDPTTYTPYPRTISSSPNTKSGRPDEAGSRKPKEVRKELVVRQHTR